jgi:hypothetical protein
VYAPSYRLPSFDTIPPAYRTKVLEGLLDALALANLAYLLAHPHTPRLADSGVRYADEADGMDEWQDIPDTLDRRNGDSEDLAAWRMAELQRGEDPRARWYITGDTPTFYIAIARSDGSIEDPARELGGRPGFSSALALRPPGSLYAPSFRLKCFESIPHEFKRRTLEGLLNALALADTAYLATQPHTPPLYQAGVRYVQEPEGRDEWQDVPDTIARRTGDCEDLASWRMAELRAGEDPWARWRISVDDLPYPSGRIVTTYHIALERSDGRTEDPSRLLGME